MLNDNLYLLGSIYLIYYKLISHSYHFLNGHDHFESVNFCMHEYFLMPFPPLENFFLADVSIMLRACLIVLLKHQVITFHYIILMLILLERDSFASHMFINFFEK